VGGGGGRGGRTVETSIDICFSCRKPCNIIILSQIEATGKKIRERPVILTISLFPSLLARPLLKYKICISLLVELLKKLGEQMSSKLDKTGADFIYFFGQYRVLANSFAYVAHFYLSRINYVNELIFI
jgi:hypothetical protein